MLYSLHEVKDAMLVLFYAIHNKLLLDRKFLVPASYEIDRAGLNFIFHFALFVSDLYKSSFFGFLQKRKVFFVYFAWGFPIQRSITRHVEFSSYTLNYLLIFGEPVDCSFHHILLLLPGNGITLKLLNLSTSLSPNLFLNSSMFKFEVI